MSDSAIGLVKTISVLSPSRIRSFPSTVIALPSNSVIVPRTRVGVWARVAVTTTSNKRKLLRRLDAIFAHRDALRDELAVLLARAGEDGLAGLEIGARARREGVVLGLRRDQDLLLAVFVLERELRAGADLRGALERRVRHHRIGNRIPRRMHLRHLRS